MIKRIQLYTTSACQLNCEFCAKSKQNIPSIFMDMDDFIIFVDISIKAGITEFELSPLVGEAFLDKLIIERVEYLETIPEVTKIFFFTNCVDISEDNIKRLNACKKFGLHLSLYGDTHESFKKRTGKDMFENVLGSIMNIIRYKANVQEVVIRYTPSKIEYLPWKILFGTLQDCYPTLNFCENSFDINWNTKMIYVKDTLEAEPIKCNGGICEYLEKDIGIWPNGDVGICTCWFDINKRMILGNVYKTTLNELFEKVYKIKKEQDTGLYRSLCSVCNLKEEL